MDIIREHNSKATVITTPWDQIDGKKILETIENAKDLEAELMAEVTEHHHDHDHEHEHECGCGCGHDHDHEHEHHHHHEHDEDACPVCGGHHDHDHEHEHHHHDEHDHEHEHHHDEHDHEHDHHHHHHHADEVFTSWGMETPQTYTQDEISAILSKLEDEETYGIILRAKGMLPVGDGTWVNFDYVPGESNVRLGVAEVTGKICVIGSKLKEDNLKTLFAK